MTDMDDQPEPEDAAINRRNAIIESHCKQLMEHFDSVRIVATRYDAQEDRSTAYSVGAGCVYAQQGAVKEWIDRGVAKAQKLATEEDE